ncbi:protein phosphatase 1 regulatory subunit 15A [Salminus brasiliensis]|uniref:protein phosphatase 1 regulatory subunit 15A n=1 Tax=Salminus brasiliensis TaxID=930266 RepID=UPI003B836248
MFTTHPRHPLYYWCLPQMAMYIPSMKNLVHPANMTRMKENLSLSPYAVMSVQSLFEKIGLHLWDAMKKLLHQCVNITELLNSKAFFMCAREAVAMAGELKTRTVGLEAQERPGLEARKMESQPASLSSITELDPQMKIMEDPMMKLEMFAGDRDEVVLADWLEWKSDCDDDDDDDEEEEEHDDDDDDDDDDEEAKEEQSPLDKEDEMEWSDEDDSDWSDDEGDSQESTESMELWESFLNSDPYNPLYFSCTTGVKTKSTDSPQLQNHTTSQSSMVGEAKMSTSGDDEQSPKKSTKEGTKKVRFSDEVTVHTLVTWSFASREARDGSCWLQLARDRERFRRRVAITGEVLSPCLTAQHRARIWDKLQREAQPELS